MTRIMLARYLCVLVPAAAVVAAAVLNPPDRRTRGAALLGLVAAGVGTAALNTVASAVGWWTFDPADATFAGAPVEYWLAWAVLWGAVPALVRLPVPLVLATLAWLDVVAMPALPLVRLGRSWLVGEAVGLAGVALPAILLGRWVAGRRHLTARVVLQFLTFAGLLLWLGPSVALQLGGGSWRLVTDLPGWQLSPLVQLAALVALPGLLAMREFAERGRGTPYPWDPPPRLVTTGPYAYVANPMQLSATGLLLLVAVATRSWAVLGAGVFAVLFSAAVASPHERDDLARRHGAAWTAYRAQVRDWWPRWRPYQPMSARVYLARGCDVCSSTATVLHGLRPHGLRLVAAQRYGTALRRARYEGADGYRADGVAAVARALEHVNLGWAVLGWLLRLPVLDRLVQIVVDSVGGAPREVGPDGTGPDGARTAERTVHSGHSVEAGRWRAADDP